MNYAHFIQLNADIAEAFEAPCICQLNMHSHYSVFGLQELATSWPSDLHETFQERGAAGHARKDESIGTVLA